VNQEMQVKVYLDVCCLCRPFDNQLIPRIRYESEAVMAILKPVFTGLGTDLEFRNHVRDCQNC